MELPAQDLPVGPIPPPGEALVLHEDPPGAPPTLLVAFAGWRMGFGGLPPFEFLRMLESFDCRKAFLRDPTPHWYLGGLPGIGPGVEDVAAYLRAHARATGVERIVTVGNSSGAYAAMLFGSLLGADEVHAFVPKTSLSRPEDFRDQRNREALLARIPEGSPFLDLPAFLAARPGPRIHVHFGLGHAHDARHALLLRGVPGVSLHGYPVADHGIVRRLRHLGHLDPILRCSAEGRPLALRGAILRARWRLRLEGWRRGPAAAEAGA